MYKKSLVRIEKENQSDLNNSVLNDIIATNDVVLSKDSKKQRLSSECKAATFMIVFVLTTIVIIIPTLRLARAKNASASSNSELIPQNAIKTSNDIQIRHSNQENLAIKSNKGKEDEYFEQTSVTLATTNLHILTTENAHVSTLIMKITQNETMSSKKETTKPYLSSTSMVNPESTTSTIIQKTMSNEETTTTPSTTSNHNLYTSPMTTQYELTTVKESQEHRETNSYNLTTTILGINSIINENNTMLISEVSTLANLIKNDSDLQSSTKIGQSEQTSQVGFHKAESDSTDMDSTNNTLVTL